ncbi:hypothetical protein NDU88_000767 [Pleurodeles waltl]|uniref:Uncharacterized protein n=1 Tax=Pleurodeles waltl TaxID=8319 RepID=A0AAV7US92_PLEWA|nr:hypothetical protein NDU88_000767 [Pleurodeles waltl]
MAVAPHPKGNKSLRKPGKKSKVALPEIFCCSDTQGGSDAGLRLAPGFEIILLKIKKLIEASLDLIKEKRQVLETAVSRMSGRGRPDMVLTNPGPLDTMCHCPTDKEETLLEDNPGAQERGTLQPLYRSNLGIPVKGIKMARANLWTDARDTGRHDDEGRSGIGPR